MRQITKNFISEKYNKKIMHIGDIHFDYKSKIGNNLKSICCNNDTPTTSAYTKLCIELYPDLLVNITIKKIYSKYRSFLYA